MRLIRAASVRTQVALLLSAGPLVIGLLSLSVVPLVARTALDSTGGSVDSVVQSIRFAIAFAMVCGVVAAAGAGIVLRRSIRTTVDELHEATAAIASGDFEHRISSSRSDELGGLAHAIDGMAERLRQLDDARHRTLACISHELRTPLTIVRGHAFTLGRHEQSAERAARLLLIDEEVGRLGALVDELVDVASLHAGGVRLERERCDLADRCRAVVDRMRTSASDVGIELRFRGGPAEPVLADLQRIDQMLLNLVANAIRHAAVGSVVDVELALDRRRACRIVVRNFGTGIVDADLERIFEPFVQLGDRPGRAGLGLAIARGIARAHGGDLGVRVSHRGQSTCATGDSNDAPAIVEFACRLPLPPATGREPSLRQMGSSRAAARTRAVRESRRSTRPAKDRSA